MPHQNESKGYYGIAGTMDIRQILAELFGLETGPPVSLRRPKQARPCAGFFASAL